MNIPKIEEALRLHINYVGKSSVGKYLKNNGRSSI